MQPRSAWPRGRSGAASPGRASSQRSRQCEFAAPTGTEAPSEADLEVKDAFSKLDSLPCVWNCAVKATLCQPEHLQHKQSQQRRTPFFYGVILTMSKTCFKLCYGSNGLPERQFQSCPRSTFQLRTCSHDRLVLKCSSLAPTTGKESLY